MFVSNIANYGSSFWGCGNVDNRIYPTIANILPELRLRVNPLGNRKDKLYYIIYITVKNLLKMLVVAIVAALVMIAVAELATIMQLSEKEGICLIGLMECMCIPLFCTFLYNKD